MKKTTLALLVCVSFSGSAFSQIYKWKDKDGNIVISTPPPPPGVTAEKKEVEKVQPASKASAGVRANPGTQDSGFKRPYKDIKVVMYMTDWCGVCRRARAFFRSLGVNLLEYDVEKDLEKNKEWLRKSGGNKGVPFIDIEGTTFLGFGQDRIRAAIEEKRVSTLLR